MCIPSSRGRFAPVKADRHIASASALTGRPATRSAESVVILAYCGARLFGKSGINTSHCSFLDYLEFTLGDPFWAYPTFAGGVHFLGTYGGDPVPGTRMTVAMSELSSRSTVLPRREWCIIVEFQVGSGGALPGHDSVDLI